MLQIRARGRQRPEVLTCLFLWCCALTWSCRSTPPPQDESSQTPLPSTQGGEGNSRSPAPRQAEALGFKPEQGRAACPEDMVLVEGLFCPEAEQECLEHHPSYVADPRQSERCSRYRRPTRCLSPQRVLMRYCIDRFEWPNQQGRVPRVLTSWGEAQDLCRKVGKRLCYEDEWLLACEGPQMLPYTYGYTRDPTACVFDRLYRPAPPKPLAKWDECQADSSCRRAFGSLDQREPSGSFARCRSPFGVYDMNGNVNEWIEVREASYPNRSGLKGGWWGPVRDRCRPTVRFHREDDWGYEVGFRCCSDGDAH